MSSIINTNTLKRGTIVRFWTEAVKGAVELSEVGLTAKETQVKGALAWDMSAQHPSCVLGSGEGTVGNGGMRIGSIMAENPCLKRQLQIAELERDFSAALIGCSGLDSGFGSGTMTRRIVLVKVTMDTT